MLTMDSISLHSGVVKFFCKDTANKRSLRHCCCDENATN